MQQIMHKYLMMLSYNYKRSLKIKDIIFPSSPHHSTDRGQITKKEIISWAILIKDYVD